MRKAGLKMLRVLPCVAAAGAVLLFSFQANASGILYQFDMPVSDAYQSPPSTAPWINATFQDVSGGVLLTVANVGLTGNEYIKGSATSPGGLFFNLNPAYSPNSLTFTLVSATGNFGTTISKGANAFKGGGQSKYDIAFDFSNQNFGANASFSYLITGVPKLNANSFAYLCSGPGQQYCAAAQMQGLPGGACTFLSPCSGPQVPPVPEPSLISLFVVCFGAYGVMRRRNKQKV